VTRATLDRLGLDFDLVIGREDARPKPDPEAIWKICTIWGLAHHEVAILGDYRFDLVAGQRAGVRTILYLGRRTQADIQGWERADFYLPGFDQADSLLAWLREPT
jgi:phosphoglycolate phosphatase-like HAD superfamily hydrolase